MSIKIEINLTDQFIEDVAINIVESGCIDYWCSCADYDNNPTMGDGVAQKMYASLLEHEQHTEHEPRAEAKLNRDLIEKGIARVLEQSFKVNPRILERIVVGAKDDDAGDIYAEVGDVIVQAAMFGEIIYG